MFKIEKNKKYEIDYLLYTKHNHGYVLILRDYHYIKSVPFSSIYEVIKGVSLLLPRDCSVSINLNEVTIETKNSLEIFRCYPE